MSQSLLLLPDISGFTKFVQSTEAEHSQHVISELLEILIDSNDLNMELAEVEGDALFFFKEREVPSLEMLLSQIEKMFTAFHSHLRLLETNRICPCSACSTASNLQLKIIAHCGELQFITVQGKRKPFGTQVIEVHRLLKNSISNDNYALVSTQLAEQMIMPKDYKSGLFEFYKGSNSYDGVTLGYWFSKVDNSKLKLNPHAQAKEVSFDRPPNLLFEKEYPVAAQELLEYITNYRYRHSWVSGEIEYLYDVDQVTRVGSEHVCIVNGKHLNFVTVTKKGNPNQLIYGELTTSPPPVDELYQFWIINPITDQTCKLVLETYWTANAIHKKLLILIAKQVIKKNIHATLDGLYEFVSKK